MRNLLRPGIEPTSLALQGGLLITGPPGKPLSAIVNSEHARQISFEEENTSTTKKKKRRRRIVGNLQGH